MRNKKNCYDNDKYYGDNNSFEREIKCKKSATELLLRTEVSSDGSPLSLSTKRESKKSKIKKFFVNLRITNIDVAFFSASIH